MTPAYAFESPVWWDPKSRGVIMKPRTFLPCMLLVEKADALVVGEHDVVCRVPVAQAGFEWPEMFDLPVCDLHPGSAGSPPFRLYFVRPHPRCPDMERETVANVAAVLGAHGLGPMEISRISVQRLSTHANLHSAGKRMQRFREMVENSPSGG